MKNVAIGIDIGGTNTVFGLVDQEGNCLIKNNISTLQFETPDDLIKSIYEHIQVMLTSFDERIIPIGIGIGAPNGNYFNGTIEYAPNLKWKGVINLIKICDQYFNMPVFVTNDANAAAIGEMTYGACKGVNDFIVLTLGTGLGSGIVANGNIIYGHDGFAGELGHTIIDENGRDCACGRKGCLETYVSATGIVRTARILLAESSISSILRNVSAEKLTAKIITDAAKKGDTMALRIFNITAQKLGFSLANTVAMYSPEKVVLFGGLANAGELITQPTKKYMEQYLLNIFKNKVQIVASQLEDGNAAILGASSLVWNELKKPHFEKADLN